MMRRIGITSGVVGSAALATLLAYGSVASAQGSSLADMEPVTLRVATLYGPDSWHTPPIEAFTRRLEERTGGKLKFEYYYGGSLVPARELADAMGSGIFDLGQVLPAYDPTRFPVDEWQGTLAIPAGSDPIREVLTLALAGYEWNSQLEAHTKEFLDAGIFPLIHSLSITGPFGILCKEDNSTLDSLAGKRSRVAGSTWTGEATNLGMTPVALAITEVYQAFQSGVIDCWIGGLGDAGALGFFDHGKYYNLAAGLTAYAQSVYGLNKDMWESLPKDVQDIIWDETAELVADSIRVGLQLQVDVAKASSDLGVIFTAPDDAMRQKVDDYHDKVRAEAALSAPASVDDAAAEVARLSELKVKWGQLLRDELGFGDSYASWGEVVEKDAQLPGFDLLTERIKTEIIEPLRAER